MIISGFRWHSFRTKGKQLWNTFQLLFHDDSQYFRILTIFFLLKLISKTHLIN
jgi:hypothetical protein